MIACFASVQTVLWTILYSVAACADAFVSFTLVTLTQIVFVVTCFAMVFFIHTFLAFGSHPVVTSTLSLHAFPCIVQRETNFAACTFVHSLLTITRSSTQLFIGNSTQVSEISINDVRSRNDQPQQQVSNIFVISSERSCGKREQCSSQRYFGSTVN